jgi:hypothetical protein
MASPGASTSSTDWPGIDPRISYSNLLNTDDDCTAEHACVCTVTQTSNQRTSNSFMRACVWCVRVVHASDACMLSPKSPNARHGTTRHDTKRHGTHTRTTNTHAHMQHARKQTRMHAHTPTCTHAHTHARTHKFIAGALGLGSCNSAAARTRALQCNRSSSNLISYRN